MARNHELYRRDVLEVAGLVVDGEELTAEDIKAFKMAARKAKKLTHDDIEAVKKPAAKSGK